MGRGSVTVGQWQGGREVIEKRHSSVQPPSPVLLFVSSPPEGGRSHCDEGSVGHQALLEECKPPKHREEQGQALSEGGVGHQSPRGGLVPQSPMGGPLLFPTMSPLALATPPGEQEPEGRPSPVAQSALEWLPELQLPPSQGCGASSTDPPTPP